MNYPPPSGNWDNVPGVSNSYSVNSKIMIVAIVVLFGVVMFILGLHVYAKWFWRNGAGLHYGGSGSWRRRRRLDFAADVAGQARSSEHVGLDEALVEKLPTFTYNLEKATVAGLECAVCLEEFVDGEKGRLLPKCSHSFHIDCIDMWFNSHSTCPLCRCSVVPDLSSTETSSDPSAPLESSNSIPSSDGAIYIPGSGIPVSGVNPQDDPQYPQAVFDNVPLSEIPEASAPSSGIADLSSSQRRPSSAGVSPKPSGVVQYPANVLFWGNQSQMNVGYGSGLQREENLARQSSNLHAQNCLVIEIPKGSASTPASVDEPSRLSDAQGPKSPIGRLVSTSFRRLLSIKRGAISPGPEGNSSCDGNDCEQGTAGFSTGTAQR